MKVLFLNPPFLKHYSRVQRSPAVTKSGTLYYPYWLCFAAGVLLRQGIECDLIDAIAKGCTLQDILDLIEKSKFDVVVCDTSTPSIHNDLTVLSEIKKLYPTILTICVGTHVSSLPAESLKSCPSIDVIARGEYDYTILDCVQHRADLSGVLGITYRSATGEIHSNPNRPLISDVDSLPSLTEVYKRFLDIHDYYFSPADYPMIMLITGRGCYGRCFFCLYPQTMFGRKYRCMSAQKVAEEMTKVKQTFPEVQEIVFEDDTFTADPKRIRELCQLLIERSLGLKWTCNARVGLDFETMKLMKKAGCRLLVAGYESGNQELLDRMNKGITLSQSRQFAKNAKRAGLLVHGCFMFGFPGETKETMDRTLAFAKELSPDSAQFYPLFVYPGTEGYQWAKSSELLVEENYEKWIGKDGEHRSIIDLGNGLTPEFVTTFCEQAYRTYHLSPSYFVKKIFQLGTSPREGLRSLRNAYNYFFAKK